jgi:hypothetical protein
LAYCGVDKIGVDGIDAADDVDIANGDVVDVDADGDVVGDGDVVVDGDVVDVVDADGDVVGDVVMGDVVVADVADVDVETSFFSLGKANLIFEGCALLAVIVRLLRKSIMNLSFIRANSTGSG